MAHSPFHHLPPGFYRISNLQTKNDVTFPSSDNGAELITDTNEVFAEGPASLQAGHLTPLS
jgi:hypothetical protein